MSSRNRKLVLILVTLALVIAPLRAALALPAMTVANESEHCQQMQDDIPAVAVDNQDHNCDQGCGGDCCDGACNACAHGSVAVSDAMSVTPDNHEPHLNSRVSYGISGRTVHPPFRPPIALQS